MKIMITGFNPFNGEKVNPAQEVLKFLPDTIKGHRLVKLNIETSFEKAASQVYDALLAEMPDYCINIGQAGGRSGITPEKNCY
ncbi:pyroglutamyl-peptidase I [Lactobacillus iners LactinV 01V1-a]|uniref:Pyrrolidone-carboxylate peptidase n=1 Tax=Lactobacillus iners LactinV 01V1-a TaxID=879297 RepID=E1NTA4_9LACO|nr:pyroglutamyl-peptidase I [Lactobacillus iners LactinV 01V1-a]